MSIPSLKVRSARVPKLNSVISWDPDKFECLSFSATAAALLTENAGNSLDFSALHPFPVAVVVRRIGEGRPDLDSVDNTPGDLSSSDSCSCDETIASSPISTISPSRLWNFSPLEIYCKVCLVRWMLDWRRGGDWLNPDVEHQISPCDGGLFVEDYLCRSSEKGWNRNAFYLCITTFSIQFYIYSSPRLQYQAGNHKEIRIGLNRCRSSTYSQHGILRLIFSPKIICHRDLRY